MRDVTVNRLQSVPYIMAPKSSSAISPIDGLA
jgi:hypothetical protein